MESIILCLEWLDPHNATVHILSDNCLAVRVRVRDRDEDRIVVKDMHPTAFSDTLQLIRLMGFTIVCDHIDKYIMQRNVPIPQKSTLHGVHDKLINLRLVLNRTGVISIGSALELLAQVETDLRNIYKAQNLTFNQLIDFIFDSSAPQVYWNHTPANMIEHNANVVHSMLKYLRYHYMYVRERTYLEHLEDFNILNTVFNRIYSAYDRSTSEQIRVLASKSKSKSKSIKHLASSI